VPYCFLTYMLRVPSRQTYLASLGLAWLAAAGYDVLRRTTSRTCVTCCVIAVFALSLGTLWLKKRRQFQERAAPTEQVIAVARRTPGPIWIQCFPRNHYIAEEAIHLGGGHPASDAIWDEATAQRLHATVFCYREQ